VANATATASKTKVYPYYTVDIMGGFARSGYIYSFLQVKLVNCRHRQRDLVLSFETLELAVSGKKRKRGRSLLEADSACLKRERVLMVSTKLHLGSLNWILRSVAEKMALTGCIVPVSSSPCFDLVSQELVMSASAEEKSGC
jgi:hypothetical protein